MTLSIIPKMVQRFKIDGRCMQRSPCSHSCRITLTNRREKQIGLDGDEIYALINVVPKNKIVGNDGHFDKFKKFEGFQNNYSRPIPNEILSKIFKK